MSLRPRLTEPVARGADKAAVPSGGGGARVLLGPAARPRADKALMKRARAAYQFLEHGDVDDGVVLLELITRPNYWQAA